MQLTLFPEKKWWELSTLERAENYVTHSQHEAMAQLIANMKASRISTMRGEYSRPSSFIKTVSLQSCWYFGSASLHFWTLWLYRERGVIFFSTKYKPESLIIKLCN